MNYNDVDDIKTFVGVMHRVGAVLLVSMVLMVFVKLLDGDTHHLGYITWQKGHFISTIHYKSGS